MYCSSSRNRQPCRFVIVADPALHERLAGLVHAPPNVRDAALVIALVVSGRGPVDFDAGRAAQNMMLAAWNDGVASCPNGLPDPAPRRAPPRGRAARWTRRRRAYVAALKRGDLRALRFHDLRHTCGSLAINYASIVAVRAWMGHADVNTTMRYLDDKRRADDARLLSHAFRANGDAADEGPRSAA